ncbi:hypothetical protein D3C87_2201090 [compost metagenome]
MRDAFHFLAELVKHRLLRSLRVLHQAEVDGLQDENGVVAAHGDAVFCRDFLDEFF